MFNRDLAVVNDMSTKYSILKLTWRKGYKKLTEDYNVNDEENNRNRRPNNTMELFISNAMGNVDGDGDDVDDDDDDDEEIIWYLFAWILYRKILQL